MPKTTLTRKLAALLFVALGAQVVMASAASANGLLGLGILGPPPAPRPPAAGSAPATPSAPAVPTLQQVEQKLDALHYDVGPIDGNADDQTASAVMAFQKVNGLDRTGELTDALKSQIMATQGNPPALVPGDAAPNKVEVDLNRQVLFLYENGSLSKILPVSSGTSKTPTPAGDYAVYRQDPGWETSPLGRLYNAQYFSGGYAIHGSPSVPAQPASHGCVRIPMSAAEWFPQHVHVGTPVHIVG